MHRNAQPKDILPLHKDLYPIFLSNLSFRNLNQVAESELDLEEIQRHATQLLTKEKRGYLCLRREMLKGNYAALIDNLLARAWPFGGFPLRTRLFARNQATYQRLCTELGPLLSTIVKSNLVADHVNHEMDTLYARDVIFHYCQYKPQAAGELLNSIILKSWSHANSYLAAFLVQYGANVNAKTTSSNHSTLFHALTFNPSIEMIRLLIDHGADYAGYREERHGVTYTLMLITALNNSQEALSLLVEKFPQELSATVETLNTMLADNNDHKYSCEVGAYKPANSRGEIKKTTYTVQEIERAKASLLQLSCESTPEETTRPPSPRRPFGSFFNTTSLNSEETSLGSATLRESATPTSG